MKPPTTFTLAGETWSIRPDADLVLIGEADGMTIPSRHEVRYNPDLGPARLRQVVVHELEHVVWLVCGVDPSCVPVGQVEEHVCSTTASTRVELFRSNPRLVAWLTA